MDRKYDLKTVNSNYSNRTVYQNSKPINDWTYGKLKTINPYSSSNDIGNKILENLPDLVLQNLLAFAEEIYFERNEIVFQPGDAVKYVYFPETSVVSEFQILEDGKTIEIAMTGCEGIVGFSSVLNSPQSPHWSQISNPGKAFKLEAEIFRREFKSSDALQKSVYNFVNSYIAQISQRVVCSSHHLMEGRLCCWLLMFCDRCESDRFELTQEQIARFLGVHRPSVTLITKSLRDKKIIDYWRGKIFIRNRAELENLTCACYENTKCF